MRIKKAVEGFLIARAADGLSENSIAINEWALSHLIDYTGNIELEKIDLDILRGFMYFMRREYKPNRMSDDTSQLAGSSVNRIWSSVRAFFNFAEVEFGTHRPDMRLPQPRYKTKVIKVFTEDKIKSLLKAAEYSAVIKREGFKPFRRKRSSADRDIALILVLLDTGIRASECARLVYSDLDLVNSEIVIRPYNSSVKSRPRTVYLGKAARRALWRYLVNEDMYEEDPVFRTQRGKPMDRKCIRKVLVRIGELAGVDNVYPHRFRHTFATQFLRNGGGNVFVLKRLLGHSTLTMVQTYLELAESDDKNVHRRASPADRWSL
jgi:integrase